MITVSYGDLFQGFVIWCTVPQVSYVFVVCSLFEKEMLQWEGGWNSHEGKQMDSAQENEERADLINWCNENKWCEVQVKGGAELSQLGSGLRIWEQTELGRDTVMGWRNVTHAIKELPVCLQKWRPHENALGHRHLRPIANPLPSASPPGGAQSGWKSTLLWQTQASSPATAPFPSTPTAEL